MDFRILGPLEAYDGEHRLPLGGARQRALLGLLLLHANEVVPSDRLIEELWQGEREDGAKALQVAISRLRKALEPGLGAASASTVVITRPPGYELRLEPDQIDLARFERLVREGRDALAGGEPDTAAQRFQEGLALWRGPPLADLAYEAFCQTEIGRLEELRLSALEDRLEADLQLARHAAVVSELEALIARHPLRERFRAQLMLALYRSGRQADALDAYADARRTLVDELGIEPGRELRELQDAILRQEPALEARLPAEVAPDATRGLFVGRERELAELREALEAALAGRGRLVLLAGEPGIGKSRLAEESIVQARARGLQVTVGRCWEAGGAPPYWPWVQALRAYVRATPAERLRAEVGTGGAELAAVLPELRELLPDLPPVRAAHSEGARFRLFESVASFLERAAAANPLALFFDDLHAADAPSLLLLRFVAAQLADAQILIVAAYRDTEEAPQLAEALAELSREPAVSRIALGGLGGFDTSRLLELTLGDAPTDSLAAQVHAETEGNPLFATEIARLLASEGARGPAEGRLPIPQGVREAIGRRLQRRSGRCREVLTLASIIGREFDPQPIATVAGLDEETLFQALDEAAAARLVDGVPGESGRLRFSHILVRDALYEDLAAPRRILLHRSMAEALEELYAGNPEPHLAELAHHYLQSGSAVAEKAIGYAQRAGDRAASQHGYEEAAHAYSNALGVLEGAGRGDPERACELLLSLGEVLSRAGMGEEAKQALRRAARLAERAGRPDQLARAALEYGGRFAWARASTDPALVPLLERALTAVGEEDSSTRVRLLARLAGATRDDRTRDRRSRLAEEAMAIATRIDDPATTAFAMEGSWVALEGPDVAGEGAAVGQRLMALGEQIGDKERVFAGHDHRLHNLWWCGDRAGVEVELEAIRRLASELGQPAQRWHLGTGETMLALMEGRFERAEQLIADTLAVGQRAQSWNAVVSHRLALFGLRRAQGRLAELEDTIRRSTHEYPALPRFRCALVHLLAELRRERDARAAFDAMLSRDLGEEHFDAEWLFSITLLADPCAFLDDRAAAAKLYSLLLPYERLYVQAPVELSFGSVARALGVLATTRGRFDDAERHFEAGLELERRMRAWPWLAHTRHDYGRMLRESGDESRGRELLGAARDEYRELGMDHWAERTAALLR